MTTTFRNDFGSFGSNLRLLQEIDKSSTPPKRLNLVTDPMRVTGAVLLTFVLIVPISQYCLVSVESSSQKAFNVTCAFTG